MHIREMGIIAVLRRSHFDDTDEEMDTVAMESAIDVVVVGADSVIEKKMVLVWV